MIKSKFIFKGVLLFSIILLSFSTQAQIIQLLNNFGKYQVRADACGTNGASCTITIEKPVGATTLYQAYIYYSSTAGAADPGPNALTLSGGSLTPAIVPITNLTSSSSGPTIMYTRYEDITTLLSPFLDAAPAGNTVYTVAEASPGSIDGDGIIVVWNNPTILSSAVHISLGSKTTATLIEDSILTAPINTLLPGFSATLGLGFAFSTGTGTQISTVSINGAVLDINAGGLDDGDAFANGSLITLGGFGDSKPTLDDEYYDFASFIPNGSTQVKYEILTTNGHTADWLNAVYFEITGVTAATDTTLYVCTGDSLLLGGSFQNAPGTYYDTLTSYLGLDSVHASTLVLYPIDTTQTANAICLGDSILLGGAFQTVAGVYYDTITSSLGCDSIIATTLTTMIFNGQTNTAICQGDSILIGGAYQSIPGVYNDTLTSYQGCDSVVAITLTTMIFNGQTNSAICQGDSALIGGIYQSIAGIYNDTLISFQGCDSVVAHTLTINPLPPIITSADTSICPEDSAMITVIGPLTYNWDNGLGTGFNHMVGPIVTTTYTATAIDLNGCENSGSVTVYVINCDTIEPSSILIPNVFTPNGSGGNDVFTVKGKNLKSVECQIFNRWGQLLYSWSDVEGSWDGGDAPDGTYFYIIRAEGLDGEEYLKNGAFSLIR